MFFYMTPMVFLYWLIAFTSVGFLAGWWFGRRRPPNSGVPA